MKNLTQLENAKQVMQALLSGHKLIWKGYGDDERGDMYLYLDLESGYLCEEDGAGLKSNRIDLTFRGENPNWRILE